MKSAAVETASNIRNERLAPSSAIVISVKSRYRHILRSSFVLEETVAIIKSRKSVTAIYSNLIDPYPPPPLHPPSSSSFPLKLFPRFFGSCRYSSRLPSLAKIGSPVPVFLSAASCSKRLS
jgi:hypothetical protein